MAAAEKPLLTYTSNFIIRLFAFHLMWEMDFGNSGFCCGTFGDQFEAQRRAIPSESHVWSFFTHPQCLNSVSQSLQNKAEGMKNQDQIAYDGKAKAT